MLLDMVPGAIILCGIFVAATSPWAASCPVEISNHRMDSLNMTNHRSPADLNVATASTPYDAVAGKWDINADVVVHGEWPLFGRGRTGAASTTSSGGWATSIRGVRRRHHRSICGVARREDHPRLGRGLMSDWARHRGHQLEGSAARVGRTLWRRIRARRRSSSRSITKVISFNTRPESK